MKIFFLILIANQVFSLPTKYDLVKPKEIQALQGAGLGWDYLTEGIRFPPQKITFNDNKKTTDGKFLIPDCMAVENVKITKYTDLASIIQSSSTCKLFKYYNLNLFIILFQSFKI